MKKTVVREYAKLIAKVGLNVQKGQDCIVYCELDQKEFIEMLVDEIYKCGARKVFVKWNDQKIEKLDYKYCKLNALSELEGFELEEWKYKSEKLPCICYIISEDPDGLNGINQDKFAKVKAERYKLIKPFKEKMEAGYQWCIAAVPGVAWAKKVFPDLRKNVAVEKLWEAILQCAKVDGNAVDNWKKHNAALKKRYEFLNAQHLTALKYKSSNGTDLYVGLNEIGLFTGGAEKTLSGVEFNPNIPSEEIFTSPMKGVCEGKVVATKPLSYEGQLIEDFYIEFKNGKVCSVHAETNETLLQKIVNMDEGASMLGECALVPYSSDINKLGFLFYETLFDENACCHLALGRGFSECIKDFDSMTYEERQEKGLNNSMIHVDFMIGSEDLEIIGVKKDGSEIKIFDKGDWAI
ncbi:MAG: aminopeptidase [Christensenellaceae bacterium]